MSFIKKSSFKVLTVSFVLMFLSFSAWAQQQFDMQMPQQQADYSDEQIDQFVNTVVKVIPIQEAAEGKMIQEIEGQGMELDQFNEIAMQVQSTGEAEGVAEDDFAKFQLIAQGLQRIQMEIQDQVVEVIQDEGMDLDLYQGIMAAYQSNPEVRQKVDTKLSEQQ